MSNETTTTTNACNQEVNRSINQLVSHLSTMNLTVPRVDAYNDIFDFITEFESITATLPAEEQIKLLVKSFPPGRLRNYYDTHIKPDAVTSDWKTIKQKIIDYYSDTEDRDRHLKRLQGMSFDISGQRKLFDYVEDLIYTMTKALGDQSDDLKIRYVKANLPAEVTNALINSSQFNNSANLGEFMKGIRQFDKSKSFGSNTDIKNELATVVKDVLTEIVKENIPRKAKVAAVHTPPRGNSPVRQRSPARPYSPGYYNQSANDRNYHNNWPQYQGQYSANYGRRSPSPARQSVGYNGQYQSRYRSPSRYQYPPPGYQSNDYGGNEPIQSYPNYQRPLTRPSSPYPRPSNSNHMQNDPSTGYSEQQQQRVSRYDQNNNNRSMKAYDESANDYYFRRFGVPPDPCRKCGLMHWERHCHFHLN